MRKVVKCAGFVFLLVSSILDSTAQSLEVKGGLNFATVTGFRDNAFFPAFYVGLAHSIPLSKHVNFQPEIFYSLQGTNRGSSSYRYHYIQMPLYFDFRIGEKGGLVWGPQIGVLARANVRDERNEISSVLPIMKVFDLSIGGGPYVKIGDKLKVDARISFGVPEISTANESIRNLVVQFGVAYAIKKPADE